jgi:hypothetical protein
MEATMGALPESERTKLAASERESPTPEIRNHENEVNVKVAKLRQVAEQLVDLRSLVKDKHEENIHPTFGKVPICMTRTESLSMKRRELWSRYEDLTIEVEELHRSLVELDGQRIDCEEPNAKFNLPEVQQRTTEDLKDLVALPDPQFEEFVKTNPSYDERNKEVREQELPQAKGWLPKLKGSMA